MSVSELTSAPAEIEVGNKKLKLWPMRWENWGAVERLVKDEIVMRGKRAMSDAALTASQRNSIISAAFDKSEEFSAVDDVLRGTFSRIASNLESMLRVICQSADNGEPNEKLRLTIKDIDDLFGGNVKQISAAYVRVIEISFPDYFHKSAKDAPSANPQKPASETA